MDERFTEKDDFMMAFFVDDNRVSCRDSKDRKSSKNSRSSRSINFLDDEFKIFKVVDDSRVYF